jgi:hypothetical protein
MSATVSHPTDRHWLPTLCGGRPHQVIGEPDAPYLHRWFLIPHNRWLNVYLHRFLRSDDPRALHDHPWWFASLIHAGGYIEVTTTRRRVRRRGSITVHRAARRHRICLPVDQRGRETRCWTVIITGPHVRQWGFWCPRQRGAHRFIPWQDLRPGRARVIRIDD